ncbi:MAG: hypothetical protein IJ877_06805 [Candidatus Gastranaerophilales bacterium]|nr:hypothetical protein [Candidatus Gastranaerophilales bacterium]
MKIKKVIAWFLMMSFVSLHTSPLSFVATAENMSLAEFLKTTDNIEASYSYPSMIATTNASGKSVLNAHTPIVIRCTETITTNDIVSGDTVNFAVVQDVRDSNGNILIKSGTPVTAQISFAKKQGMIGKSGEISINDFHTTAVDGSYVQLSGSVSACPEDQMTMSIVLSVLICPLFLLMKGDEARVPVGTTKTAYTVADVYIKPVKS